MFPWSDIVSSNVMSKTQTNEVIPPLLFSPSSRVIHFSSSVVLFHLMMVKPGGQKSLDLSFSNPCCLPTNLLFCTSASFRANISKTLKLFATGEFLTVMCLQLTIWDYLTTISLFMSIWFSFLAPCDFNKHLSTHMDAPNMSKKQLAGFLPDKLVL